MGSGLALFALRADGTEFPVEMDEFIGFAVDGAKRMQELINDLLAYSRVGTRALHMQPLHLDQLVGGVVADLAAAINDAGASVIFDSLPKIHSDPTQLRQLFENLIGKAVKFRGKRAPEVCITAEARDGTIPVMCG